MHNLRIMELVGFRTCSLTHISFDMLSEETVTVSYQILGLRPATSDDDPELIHDWRTYHMEERTLIAPGRLVQTVNPTISKIHTKSPFYLFQSNFLVALAASLFQESLGVSRTKGIQQIVPTPEFPYREGSGKFRCRVEHFTSLINDCKVGHALFVKVDRTWQQSELPIVHNAHLQSH